MNPSDSALQWATKDSTGAPKYASNRGWNVRHSISGLFLRAAPGHVILELGWQWQIPLLQQWMRFSISARLDLQNPVKLRHWKNEYCSPAVVIRKCWDIRVAMFTDPQPGLRFLVSQTKTRFHSWSAQYMLILPVDKKCLKGCKKCVLWIHNLHEGIV